MHFVFIFWQLSQAIFGKQSNAHRKVNAAAFCPRLRVQQEGARMERSWWKRMISSHVWLVKNERIYSFSQWDVNHWQTHTQWDTNTPEALPSHSAISSPWVLRYSWRKWSGIAGVSYFLCTEPASVFMFIAGPGAAFHQDHLADTDRSVYRQSSDLMWKTHSWIGPLRLVLKRSSGRLGHQGVSAQTTQSIGIHSLVVFLTAFHILFSFDSLFLKLRWFCLLISFNIHQVQQYQQPSFGSDDRKVIFTLVLALFGLHQPPSKKSIWVLNILVLNYILQLVANVVFNDE